MSAATDTLENQLLLLLFNNAALTGLGDAGGLLGSEAAGSLYVSLHTADPGEAGAQNTSEATYTGYARVAVARSGAGWTITDNGWANAATVQFPSATAGGDTLTHVGIGTAASGAGKLLWHGAFSDPETLEVSPGIAPKFDAGTLAGTVN